MTWRMAKSCEDCPFNDDGPGLHLRESLNKSRWSEIKRGLLRGEHFTCHKTTEWTGNGSNLMCAGAIQFQNDNGRSSNLQRVMERLDYMHAKGDLR